MSMYFTQQGNVRRANEHRICMNFMLRSGWHISFLEADCRTSLPLQLTFADADKIREMYERFGAERTLADRAAVEHGIEIGRGAIWLRLTPEQYVKLKRRWIQCEPQLRVISELRVWYERLADEPCTAIAAFRWAPSDVALVVPVQIQTSVLPTMRPLRGHWAR